MCTVFTSCRSWQARCETPGHPSPRLPVRMTPVEHHEPHSFWRAWRTLLQEFDLKARPERNVTEERRGPDLGTPPLFLLRRGLTPVYGPAVVVAGTGMDGGL